MGFISLMSEKCSRLPTSRRRAYGVNSYQLLDVFTSELVRLPPFYLLVRLTPPLVFGLCSHLGSRLRVLVRLALLVCLMESWRSGTGHSRTPRGRRSFVSQIGRLEPWAQALWRDFRIITEPRRLRQILNCLRSLLSMLENRLEDLEAQEATRGT